MTLCLNVYKRHHADPEKLKDGIVQCTRCERILYETESAKGRIGRLWVAPEDAHLGAVAP